MCLAFRPDRCLRLAVFGKPIIPTKRGRPRRQSGIHERLARSAAPEQGEQALQLRGDSRRFRRTGAAALRSIVMAHSRFRASTVCRLALFPKPVMYVCPCLLQRQEGLIAVRSQVSCANALSRALEALLVIQAS